MAGNPSLIAVDPDPGGLEIWLFDHAQDHIRLAEVANQKFPQAKLEFRILDPLPGQLDDWLLDHQRMHDDLSLVTNVINNDLQTVDFNDPRQRQAWLDLNQQEHAAFSAALGV